jgi:RNA polymerase sigma-70 factor, ECF subfamily
VNVDPAFQRLYEEEAGSVFRTVYLLCRDRSVAEEATQEAFARALERWPRLRDRPWVGGWITTTAVNVARRAMRRRRSPQPADATGTDVEEAVDLWRAVRTLSLRQQQAVVLRYRLDLTVEDVAAAMGCDAGTVRTHLARAREALRARMGGIDVRT